VIRWALKAVCEAHDQEVLMVVDERDCQLPRRPLRRLECKLKQRLNYFIAVCSTPARSRRMVLNGVSMSGSIAIVRAREGRPRDTELDQVASD
jgi:hypothetical protein